ncbi:alpha/beta hydrolase [Paenibacillus sonchi]|uniref:Alpha/beta hydrolase n=1 Tax=Paenibacillus sonchi TaxID=373687 RepID=A0A974PCY4_9BACL|nr:alpha/beta hydrolase [Paenibacillus sonchi]QQZ61221.1 alpha/beta hydrolase [Paenibacillus sonchi]
MKKRCLSIISALLAFTFFATTVMASETSISKEVSNPSETVDRPVKTAANFKDLATVDEDLKVKIDSLLKKNIFEGVSETSFGIDENTTRSQFAKILALVYKIDIDKNVKTSSFLDVHADDSVNGWAIPYIEAAKKVGILEGVKKTAEGSLFSPGDGVTIGEFAAALIRGLGLKVDTSGSPWYEDAVKQAIANKLLPEQIDGSKLATRLDLVIGAYGAIEAFAKKLGSVNVNDKFALNKDRFFAKAFSKTLDMSQPVTWGSTTLEQYNSLSDTNKETLNHIKRVDEVYESASLTFYPNGKVRVASKITDKVYNALAENDIFKYLQKQTVNEVLDYSVDSEKRLIALGNGATYIYNPEVDSVYRQSILANEVFSSSGEVGDIPTDENEDAYTIFRNVQYGSDPTDIRNQMDVYVPKNLDSSKENGAFLLLYGGGWISGGKESTQKLARFYASKGYISVAINMHNTYINPKTFKAETTVFDMLNDIQHSVKKLKELSDEKKWNITQMSTYGESAGGNLAMIYAYSRGTKMPYFDTQEILPVKFVVDLVGPADMHYSAWGGDKEWKDREFHEAFGSGPGYAVMMTGATNKPDLTEEEKEKYIQAMSPVSYVETYGGVPTVMGYAKRDTAQNPNNGKLLKGYLDNKSIPNDLFTFPNSIHGLDKDPKEAEAFYAKSIEYAQTYFNKAK